MEERPLPAYLVLSHGLSWIRCLPQRPALYGRCGLVHGGDSVVKDLSPKPVAFAIGCRTPATLRQAPANVQSYLSIGGVNA